MNKDSSITLASVKITEFNQLILDHLLDAVVVIDSSGLILYFSKPAEAMFGVSSETVIGHNVKLLMPADIAREHDQYMNNYQRTGQANVIGVGREVEARHSSGRLFPVDLAITETEVDGERVYIGVLRDITKQRENVRTIDYLANFDQLTGLPNRDKLIRELEEMLAYSPVCVAAINLDFFNRINTVHGYAEGDNVLYRLANRMRNHIDISALIGRDLGDRFWIVVPIKETTVEAARREVEALLEMIRQPVETDLGLHFLTGSAGIVVGEQGASALELLSQAEAAVYQAKLEGRDRMSLFEPQMRSKVAQDYEIENALRKALSDGELQVWIQSKVDKNARVKSAEALLRWKRVLGGQTQIVSPGVFIPLAERIGLIVPIGEFVFQQVAQTLTRLSLQPETAGISLALNVSPRQFMAPKFVEMVEKTFRQYQAPLDKLIIEITENLLLRNLTEVHAVMQELAVLGVRFSIDDFGTGYSNLKRLQQLPLHEIKIDQSFVHGIGGDAKAKAILDAILMMCKSLDLATVAEGVETHEQAEYLTARHCDLLQGYLFSRPAPLADWLDTLLSATHT